MAETKTHLIRTALANANTGLPDNVIGLPGNTDGQAAMDAAVRGSLNTLRGAYLEPNPGGGPAAYFVRAPGIADIAGVQHEFFTNLGATIGAPAATTWYHAYLVPDGGWPTTKVPTVRTVDHATDPPTRDLVSTVTPADRWLGTLRTNGGSAIIPYFREGDWVYYLTPAPVFGPVALPAITTPISLAPFVPPTSTRALVRFTLSAGAPGDRVDYDFVPAAGASPKFFVSSGFHTVDIMVETDPAQTIHFIGTLTGAPVAEVFVLGYMEPRNFIRILAV